MSSVPPGPGDDLLIERARRGDEEAWAELYRRHQGPIYRFALRMGATEAMAEETVQETFITVLSRLDRFDATRGSFRAFAIGIARNKWRKLAERESCYEPLEDQPSPAEPVVKALAGREQLERLERAIRSLPAAYREAVVLCDLEEMDYTEAALAMGCPVGTVRSRLSRARQMLTGRLHPLMKTGGER